MGWAGQVALISEKRKAHAVLMEKPKGKRTPERTHRIRKDYIKIYLK
jgi:hypothetical protein